VKIILLSRSIWHHIAWPLTPRDIWFASIQVYSEEIGWVGADWIDLAQDRDRWWDLMSVAMNIWFYKILRIL